jgi:hypothetical protein
MGTSTIQRERRLSRRLKRAIRGSLWHLLVRLDRSLVHNLPHRDGPKGGNGCATQDAPPSHESVATTIDPAISPAAHSELPADAPTLVFDSGGVLPNTDALRMLLCAAFETEKLSAEQEDLFRHLADRPGLWADVEHLLRASRAYLLIQLGRPATNEETLLSALKALAVHERKTDETRHAYDTQHKSNPAAVHWPNPTSPDHPSTLFDQLPIVRSIPLIERTTPIGSAGSCFAMEIAYRLQRDGFNYIVTEPFLLGDEGLSVSCARWGTIFNTPSFRQLIEKSLGSLRLPKIVWSLRQGGTTEFRDPFREDVIFSSLEEYERTYESHLAMTREALLRAKVFVLTLGMNEVWRMKSNGCVFSRTPWRITPDLVEKRVLTVEENLAELQRMLDVWRTHNEDIQLIVSVSPVPLHATFRADDVHVVTANCHSKSVLRVVAEEFAARNEGVHYFPSYEVVTCCTREPWDADQRHVSRQAVDNVMRLFQEMFVVQS